MPILEALIEIWATFVELLVDLFVLFLDLACLLGVVSFIALMVTPLILCYGPVVESLVR